ncbi:MAG: hypothetical protein JXA68_10660, partial [Ignavibacteriales bacterium]|nr:hypothetical protein [Ignavibacteriales bacterium]
MKKFKVGIIFATIISSFILLSCNESQEKESAELPNLVGKWVGEGNAIIYGNLDHREVADTHTF